MDFAFAERAGLSVVVVIVFAFLLRLAQRLLQKPGAADNDARRLYFAGQLIGLLWMTTSIVRGVVSDDSDFGTDVLWSFVFAGAGFVLYLLGGQLGVRLLLGRHLGDEIESGNSAAALAGAAHHVATGILVGVACTGTDLFGLSLASLFFGLGLIAQQLVSIAFRALTTYDDAEQVAGENMAAAISWSGTAVAAAIVVARAIEGDAETFSDALIGFAEVAAIALVLLPVRQILVGGLLFGRMPRLRGGPLDDAVGLHHDSATAVLDAAVAIGAAVALARLV